MAKRQRGLFLGVLDEHISMVRSHFNDLNVVVCSSADGLPEHFEGIEANHFQFVFVSEQFIDLPIAKLTELLRAFLPSQPLYYVTNRTQFYDRDVFLKKGMTDSFLLPMDKDCMDSALAKIGDVTDACVYTPVCLVDIEPDTKLDFEISIFMPLNEKYVALSRQGDKLGKDRLKRLKSFSLNSIYVPAEQIDSFHDYSAKRLLELHDGSAPHSATDRQVRLRTSVREFVTGLVSSTYSPSLSEGQGIKENVRSIVERFITLKGSDGWYEEIMSRVGQTGDAYSHTSHVSLYSALFSLVLKIGRPDELAIAGMLHDIGLTMLPPNLQERDLDTMTEQELADYHRHPELTLEVIRARHLPVTDAVMIAISQHHERWNGSGFPNGISARRMSNEAQILAVADRFDYLTKVEARISPLDPMQALNRIAAEEIANPDITQELQTLFKRRTAA